MNNEKKVTFTEPKITVINVMKKDTIQTSSGPIDISQQMVSSFAATDLSGGNTIFKW